MKIFEALRIDHDKQRALVKIILDTTGESSTRQEYFQQLKLALKAHATAEERFFYAPLLKADSTIHMSRHGIAEHHQIDKLIEKLDSTKMSSSSWLLTFKKLAEKVEHHLKEEEHEFFQLAGKALSEDEKSELAISYRDEMES